MPAAMPQSQSQPQTQLSPQVLQALQQQQGAGAVDIGDMLQQLMAMSPEEVAATLQQMGIQVSPEQVQSAAENWVDQAADDASGNPAQPSTQADDGGESPEDQSSPDDAHTPSSSAPAAPDDEAAEPTPDDEEAEGESEQVPAGASPQQQGATAMPRGGMPSGAGGSMDDLISAAMMQQAAGDPNADVPTARGMPSGPARPMRPSAPSIPMRGGPTADPRIAAVIANAYRANMPTARGAQGPTATPTARRRRV